LGEDNWRVRERVVNSVILIKQDGSNKAVQELAQKTLLQIKVEETDK
jgi:hypothetical protein